jgi:hypothetical protein
MSGIVYYPDGASFQSGISLAGWLAFMAKATEGTGYRNPAYPAQRGEAARRGARFGAYHFLHGGNAAAQADACFGVVGRGVPLMVDHEPTAGALRQLLGLAPGDEEPLDAVVARMAGRLPEHLEPGHAERLAQVSAAEPRTMSRPSVQDTAQFVDRYRALGGTVWKVYLPRWYWGQLGSPSLAPLAARGLELVTSNYSGNPEQAAGPGWQTYGGMPTVKTWQYTSSGTVNGMRPVDLNAFRGTGSADPRQTLGELWNLWTTGKLGGGPPVAQHPTIALNATGAGVRTAQQRLNVHGAAPQLVVDSRFGPATKTATVAFQRKHKLTADGIIGPVTWAALVKAPA